MHEFYEAGGVIRNGELKPEDLVGFRRAMKGFPDGRVLIRVEKWKNRRSNGQNRFWWGTVVKLFADHCGEHPDDMHEILKLQLLPKQVVTIDPETGEEKTVTIGRSTANLSTQDFKDLIFRAQELGARMDIYIPDPGEVAA